MASAPIQVIAAEPTQPERHVTPNSKDIRIMQQAVCNHLPYDDGVVPNLNDLAEAVYNKDPSPITQQIYMVTDAFNSILNVKMQPLDEYPGTTSRPDSHSPNIQERTRRDNITEVLQTSDKGPSNAEAAAPPLCLTQGNRNTSEDMAVMIRRAGAAGTQDGRKEAVISKNAHAEMMEVTGVADPAVNKIGCPTRKVTTEAEQNKLHRNPQNTFSTQFDIV